MTESAKDIAERVGKAILSGGDPKEDDWMDLKKALSFESAKKKQLAAFNKVAKSISPGQYRAICGICAYGLAHLQEVDPLLVMRFNMLRPSWHGYRGSDIRKIAEALSGFHATRPVMNGRLLKNILTLCDLAQHANDCFDVVNNFFSYQDGMSVDMHLTDVTAWTNLVYFFGNENLDIVRDTEARWPGSIEDVGVAFSTIVTTLRINGHVPKHVTAAGTDNEAMSNACSVLRHAAMIYEYRQVEESVLCLGYSIEEISPSHYRLSHLDERFGKAHCIWPYLHSMYRADVYLAYARSGTRESLRALTRLAVDNGDIPIDKILDSAPRLIPQISDAAVYLIKNNVIYSEEAPIIREMGSNLAILDEQVLTLHVSGVKDVTAFDLIQFTRLAIIYISALRHIFGSISANSKTAIPIELIINSALLSVSKEEMLKILMNKLDWSPPKSECILSLFTTDFSGRTSVDAQTRCLLDWDSAYRIPMAILSRSNVLRNNFMLTSTRAPTANKEVPDWLPLAIKSDLLQVGIQHVESQIKFGCEFDLIFYHEAILFVLECKATLTPSSEIEEQRSLSDIIAAARQLDDRKAFLQEGGNLRELLKVKFSIEEPNNPVTIVTGIILSNGYMDGYIHNGHCVHSLQGVRAFLNHQCIETEFGSVVLWEGAVPSGESLKRLFEGGGIMHEAVREHAALVNSTTCIGTAKVDALKHAPELFDCDSARELLASRGYIKPG